MSTEEEQASTVEPADDDAPAPAREPSWWHRDHPTFTSLAGFFTGLLFIILVPGIYAGLLSVLVDSDTAEDLFPLVLIALGVPIALTVAPRTRRFGRYMFVGILTTAVVVLATAAVVLWLLYTSDS